MNTNIDKQEMGHSHQLSLCLYFNILYSVYRPVRNIVLGGMLMIAGSSMVNADVYLDSTVTLQDNTDALVGILSESVVPGGVRNINFNGNELKVRRFANPGGDDSEFYRVWQHAAVQKQAANMDIFSVLDAHDPMYPAMMGEVPYEKPVTNIPYLAAVSQRFAKQQSSALKKLVVDAIETPFTYETNQHRAIAKIPIKSIDAKSKLADMNADDGYLFLSEKSEDTTISTAFWQIQFGDNFVFTDLFSRTEEEDVKGDQPKIERYPGSVMTMSYTEDANKWRSNSWSYESVGDVLSHITHYVTAFEKAGFTKDRNSVVQSDYGLLQFANVNVEATLFVELVDVVDNSIQITLQLRGS